MDKSETVFQELDAWMYDLEKIKYTLPRQRRQYLTLERIRDKIYELYIKKHKINYNENHPPKISKVRVKRPYGQSGLVGFRSTYEGEYK